MTAEDLTTAAPAGDLVTGQGLGAEEEEGPTDGVMRDELRRRGHNPPKRGRLGADWVDLWASGEGADDESQALNDDAAQPGDSGVTAADFIGDHARQVTAETRPKQPKAAGWRERLGAGASSPGKRRSGQEKSGRREKAPKHARVPLDRLTESVFDGLARLTRTADPVLSRTFAIEGTIAGPLVEEHMRGTMVDKAAQPLARAQAKASVVLALVGLPAGILALEQAQTLPERQRLTREAIILPMLRETAVSLCELAGPALERKMERDAERGPIYAQADQLLAYLIYGEAAGGPGPAWAATADTGDGDDQAAADTQQQATPGYMPGFMSPAPAGDPARPPYAHPYPPADPGAQLVPRP